MSNIIYLHRNLINQKVYIGKTKYTNNPNVRWCNGNGYKHQPFYKDIAKYGWNNFEHIILEENIPDELITQRENFWINYYNAIDPNIGYNQCYSGGAISDATKEKMSEAWKNNPERQEAQRQRMISLNKALSREGANNSMFGRSRSGEQAGRKRKVQCIETGQIFTTLTEASNWCNPNGSNLKSHIAQQIQGKRKSCGKHPESKVPLHWRYIDDD